MNTSTGLRVLVCGGRNYDSLGAVWGQLDTLHALQGPIREVLHGGARGADHLADLWARRNGVSTSAFPANWDKHGKAAGPIRNQEMLDLARPDLVLAFPGGPGTADMIRRARAAGVRVETPYG